MVTTIQKHRLWCKSCNDFTLHDRIFNDELKHERYGLCSFPKNEEGEQKKFASLCECGTQYTSVNKSEIPVDKLLEQRARYKEQRRLEFQKLYGSMLNGYGMSNPLETFFNDVKIGVEVVETDAGLEAEEAEKKRIRDEKRAEFNLEVSAFKKLGRNDRCLCGSGKKYKQCCLPRHEKGFQG